MNPRIVFYQLGQKFVNQREDIPEDARQVVYYTLCVGHHVGVMDCFIPLAEVPLAEFSSWLLGLPEGPGRTKLEGVLKWGEIEINSSHAPLLMPIFERVLESVPTTSEAAGFSGTTVEVPWQDLLVKSLRAMSIEPAYYLMVRKYA